ncbi:MAG: tryptophan-rich sensory protein [bacterium]|jgi:tryptophan-rich sensory protein
MERLRSDDIVKLAFSVIICMIPAFVGAMINAKAIPTWYAFANKPPFSPPDWIFAPVWTGLYILMAVALFLIWRKGIDFPGVAVAIWAFAVQLLLNGLWTPVFFGLRAPLAGLVVIGLLWVAILITIVKFFALSRAAAVMLIPYLAWVSFATAVNAAFYLLNR